MMNNGTTTEVAPVQVGKIKKSFSVTAKSGEVYTRKSFRDYKFAVINSAVFQGGRHGEWATWHSSIKNAKPCSWADSYYIIEIKA